MEQPSAAASPHLGRSLPGAGSVAVMMLVLSLAAVLRVVTPQAALEGCLGLAGIAAVSYALIRSGRTGGVSARSFVCAQLAAALLLLAWLTYRTDAMPAVMLPLYIVTVLYGVLQLDRKALGILISAGWVAHGTALFMRIDDGGAVALPAAWMQLGVLALVLAWLVFTAGVFVRLRERLSLARRRLHDLDLDAAARSARDTLTGAFHRQPLMDALEREMARSERIGKPLCVARVDVDGLRQLNEFHGPAAGDIALRRFAAAAGSALRDVDVLGRYGGNEFLVFMPDTDLAGARIATDRLLAFVAREPIPEIEGRRHLGCTVGLTEHRKGENTRLLLQRAEAQLHLAKAGGRDRAMTGAQA
jgi:diguanylate cyclase (GGDEF)-like protein